MDISAEQLGGVKLGIPQDFQFLVQMNPTKDYVVIGVSSKFKKYLFSIPIASLGKKKTL